MDEAAIIAVFATNRIRKFSKVTIYLVKFSELSSIYATVSFCEILFYGFHNNSGCNFLRDITDATNIEIRMKYLTYSSPSVEKKEILHQTKMAHLEIDG